MTRERVGSREYKVMLRPERFAGSEDECCQAVEAFWADVGHALERLEIPTQGSFDEVKGVGGSASSILPSSASTLAGTSFVSGSRWAVTSAR